MITAERKNIYVATMGTMGVGKTTVLELLKSPLQLDVVFSEEFAGNPYLEGFYKDPRRYAYQSQTFFLDKKIEQTRKAGEQLTRGLSVGQDTPIYEDAEAYAMAQFILGNMTMAQITQYRHRYEKVLPTLPKPDMIFYIEADIDVIAERIRNRGRTFERKIDIAYLKELDRLNHEFLYKNRKIPVTVINTNYLDIVHNEVHKKQFIEIAKQGMIYTHAIS